MMYRLLVHAQMCTACPWNFASHYSDLRRRLNRNRIYRKYSTLLHSWCVPFNFPILMSLDFAYFENCWSMSLMQLWIINRWAASCSAKQEVQYHLILTCEDNKLCPPKGRKAHKVGCSEIHLSVHASQNYSLTRLVGNICCSLWERWFAWCLTGQARYAQPALMPSCLQLKQKRHFGHCAVSNLRETSAT